MDNKTNSEMERAATEVDGRAYRAFEMFLKPRMAELLRTFGLDQIYHRGEGDYLYYRDEAGEEQAVLDLLGGYGAALFGHNHHELVTLAKDLLDQRQPFHAQASVRGAAGLLAERLSQRLHRSTGRSYVTTLASTGTEVVEAAIKHAELERVQRLEVMLDELRRSFRRLRLDLRDGRVELDADFLDRAGGEIGGGPIADLDELFARLTDGVMRVVEAAPKFLAIAGAFHGKSTGSLKLTYSQQFGAPWRAIGLSTVFLQPEDEDAVWREIERARIDCAVLDLGPGGAVSLGWRSVVNIGACFVEPIQGEGGIHDLSADYLATLRQAADDGGFPLVMDEIQCGMGRCGTFLASERSSQRGDYYLLSKSLGGGLAKVSALLVDQERYVHEFGYLHTSTFAEDTFSSCIALRALDILERDEDALIVGCGRKGDDLLRRLRQLQQEFPAQLRDVRGAGMMIGIELELQSNAQSPLLRVLSEQNLLGYVAAGYLLHNHDIRVAPTLAEHATLRIEPSAFVAPEALGRFCGALRRLLTLLACHKVEALVAHVVGRRGTAPCAVPDPLPMPAAGASVSRSAQGSQRVAFLANFSEPADLHAWEPRLATWSRTECERFLNRTGKFIDPFVLSSADIFSATGSCVSVTAIAVPFTPEQAMQSLRAGETWSLKMVERGVELARQLGCSVVGLGGHTSIISNNCRELVEDELALTSGNSLTVAAAYSALRGAASRLGIDLGSARLGVVGGAGNIGATLAELAIEEVGGILLVGRRAATRVLRPVAARLYALAFERVARGEASTGIAAVIADTATVRAILAEDWSGDGDLGESLRQGLEEELGEWAPIRVSTAMEALESCNLVVSATNAAQPVVFPSHIGHEPVVVCDVAVPQDVDSRVSSERPNAVVLRGGIVRAPLGQVIDIPALRADGPELYSCLAETILLGFAEHRDHYSYGQLHAARVREISELARLHGFEIVEKVATDRRSPSTPRQTPTDAVGVDQCCSEPDPR